MVLDPRAINLTTAGLLVQGTPHQREAWQPHPRGGWLPGAHGERVQGGVSTNPRVLPSREFLLSSSSVMKTDPDVVVVGFTATLMWTLYTKLRYKTPRTDFGLLGPCGRRLFQILSSQVSLDGVAGP